MDMAERGGIGAYKTPARCGGLSMEPIYYGAWVSRAADGTFVAELPDFPEVIVRGPSLARVVALASVRLSARIAALWQAGKPIPAPTGAAELLDGCVVRRAVGQFLEVREPVFVSANAASSQRAAERHGFAELT